MMFLYSLQWNSVIHKSMYNKNYLKSEQFARVRNAQTDFRQGSPVVNGKASKTVTSVSFIPFFVFGHFWRQSYENIT